MMVYKLIKELRPDWEQSGIEILHISEGFTYEEFMKLAIFLLWGDPYKLFFNPERFYIRDLKGEILAEWDSEQEYELYKGKEFLTSGYFKSLKEAEKDLRKDPKYLQGTYRLRNKSTGKGKTVKKRGTKNA